LIFPGSGPGATAQHKVLLDGIVFWQAKLLRKAAAAFLVETPWISL